MTEAHERIGTFLQDVVSAALNGGSPFVCGGEKFSVDDVRRGLADVLTALDSATVHKVIMIKREKGRKLNVAVVHTKIPDA